MAASEVPHLIIKNVPRLSQGPMELLVHSYGNVERIYYGSATSDYPLMFVVFTNTEALYKAYCHISEKCVMYQVTLKQDK